jgi:hypothetical protein
VIAHHDADVAALHEPADFAHDSSGMRSAIDEIADEHEAVFFRAIFDRVEELAKLFQTAVDITDRERSPHRTTA